MKNSIRLAKRQSEIRCRLLAIEDAGESTEAVERESAALKTELAKNLALHAESLAAESAEEDRMRAMGSNGDGQTAEVRELFSRSSLAEFVGAIHEGDMIGGALRELQDHYQLRRSRIPLEMLLSPTREQLATVTTVPSGQVNQSEIIQPVFATGLAAFLAVHSPRVEDGTATFPVLTTRPSVGGPHTASDSVSHSPGEIVANDLAPSRLQASFFYRAGDARKMPGLDAGLRAALSSGLQEAFDEMVHGQIVTDVSATASASADTWASYREKLIFNHLDGRYAMDEGDLRIVLGQASAKDMGSTYQPPVSQSAGSPADYFALASQGEVSALDAVRSAVGGLMVSPFVPAVASSKQPSIVRKGARRDAVAPVWNGVEILFDPYTKAQTGEDVLTAQLWAAAKTVRTDGFSRPELQHA